MVTFDRSSIRLNVEPFDTTAIASALSVAITTEVTRLVVSMGPGGIAAFFFHQYKQTR